MKLIPRKYQQKIFDSILKNGNTLVVLPTGLGKTLIALMLIKEKMNKGKCLFLAPTKPLVKQHFDSIKEIMGVNLDFVTMVTGEQPPTKRKEEYKKTIILATPQTIKNDLENGVIKPDFALVLFDEAHRAVKNYAYTYISERTKENSLVVGLTASPGGKKQKINEVLDKLGIENVEIRDSEDADVKQYTHKTDVKWKMISLSPTYNLIKLNLDILKKKYAKTLASFGYPPPLNSKTLFMGLRARILASRSGTKYVALMYYSLLLNLLHMLELVETQSIHTLSKYIEKQKDKTTKSALILFKQPEFQKIQELIITEEPHPKEMVLLDLVKNLDGKKAILFAQYRAQVIHLKELLVEQGCRAREFMGKKDGFTKKMQEQTIEDFRNGVFEILVASSIGEEGLDIPAVDVVIFYEPIPSEIRSIQRRGRTGRFGKGEVFVLITKNTRDEYFYWASLKKEKKMKSILRNYQNPQKTPKLTGQTKMDHFI